MLRDYATVCIGVLTLLVAAFAAYGVTNVNTEIQATKPDPIQMPDYSDQLNSLDVQIRAIKSDLSVLNDLNSDVTKIQQKLIDLEKKEAIVQTIVQTPPQMMLLDMDRTTYLPGDIIRMTIAGMEPQKTVSIQILDADDFVLVNKEAWSDSMGKVLYQLKLSDAMLPGIYEIKLISDKKTTTQQIRINKAGETTNSIPIDQYVFTVKTGKSLYHPGEIIEISGTGKPNSSVSATLTSPTGKTFNTNSSTQNDGTFLIFFSTSSNFEDGKWYITANHVTKTIVVSITID